MRQPTLTKEQLKEALAVLGEKVGGYDEVELLIVGGMAGMLAGVLPADRTTMDCDVMVYDPETAFGAVEQEAFNVAKELKLPKKWLNSAAQGYALYLPSGWEKRRKLLGQYGLLKVYYVDRFDLIALKVLAGRAVDQLDLLAMEITAQEIAQVRKHLATLPKRGVLEATIGAAKELLDALEAKR
jgi:hypothetical protein